MAWDRAQPKIKIQPGSRTLVSPRQVWDVQHSRMAIVHMAKMQRVAVAAHNALLSLHSEVEDWQYRLVISTALGQDAQTEI